MLIKMTKRATVEEVVAIENKLHDLGFKTGKMVGEEITLIGVYGDITRLPTGEVQEMGGVAAFHYQLSFLPIAVDASHGTGLRDLVHPMTLAGVMAGASVVLVEVHPNPLIAKSDGFQGLFPEQVKHLVTACEQVWETRKRIEPLYVPSALLERDYEDRVAEDKKRFFGAP